MSFHLVNLPSSGYADQIYYEKKGLPVLLAETWIQSPKRRIV